MSMLWIGVAIAGLGTLLSILALIRPIDHDESQYVAAAALRARGLLPYRDFAYFQTPLQPFLFAPIVTAAGVWAWPALRIANALLGAIAVCCVFGAARSGGAKVAPSLFAAGAFAGCEIFLFCVGTARNDALPVACLAICLWIVANDDGRRHSILWAAATGFLLAAATAVKVSYAFPAAVIGFYTLIHRRSDALWMVTGAVPILGFVVWTFSLMPEAFLFDVIIFPGRAPAEFYAASPWKLSLAAKAVDAVKFLALGGALPAFIVVASDVYRRRRLSLLDWLVLAGFLAALLPWPTWRQYLLPMLPPLFVRLAGIWDQHPPKPREIATFTAFAMAGTIPSISSLFPRHELTMMQAMRERDVLRSTLDARHVDGPIATLSPQFLPALGRLPDARFATGPFYFRSRALLDEAAERRLHLVSYARPPADIAADAIIAPDDRKAVDRDASLDLILFDWGGGTETSVVGTHFIVLSRDPR